MKKTCHFRLGLSRSVFTNRPLFTFCAVFMGTVALSFFVNVTAKAVIGIILITLILLALTLFLILKKRGRRKRAASRILLAALCLAATLLALLRATAFFDIQYGHYSRLASETQECDVTATVIECRYSSSNLSSYNIRVDGIKGEEDAGGINAILDCTYDAALDVGDKIRIRAVPSPISEYSPSVYSEKMLIADGFVIAFTSYEPDRLEVVGEADGVYFDLLRLRSRLARRLSTDDKESGGVAAALLLGDKSKLSDEIFRDFQRTGTSHILALSGLHVAVLFGIVDLLLRIFFVPKRMRMPIIALSALFYLALIGFLPSAVRAVIMLMFTYAATALSEDGDPVTALGCAGAIILAVSPATVADVGFWMSFSATFGIVTLSPKIGDRLSLLLEEKKRHKKTLLRRILRRLLVSLVNIISGLFVGVAACTFTLWAMAGGGYVSLLSPALTLIMTPLAGMILLCAPLSLIFYSTPLRFMLTAGTRIAASAMTGMTSHLAVSSKHIISMSEDFVLPLCMVTLFLAVAPLPILRRGRPKGKNRYVLRMAIVLAMGLTVLAAALSIHGYSTRHDLDVTYTVQNTQSEHIVMQNGISAVVCELSNGGNSSMSSALREAEKNGAVEIAAIMITDYHSRTPGMLYKTFSSNMVRRLWLPEPTSEEDYYVMLSCIEKAELASPPVEVSIYAHGEELTVFEEGKLKLYRAEIDRSVQPVFLMTLRTPSQKTAYLHPAFCECDGEFIDTVNATLGGVDNLIVGRRGPKIKQSFELDGLGGKARRIILASEEIVPFTHVPKRILRLAEITVGNARIKMRLGN